MMTWSQVAFSGKVQIRVATTGSKRFKATSSVTIELTVVYSNS